MKDRQICILIEQLAVAVEQSIGGDDTDLNCRLLDAKEHLRRAWHCVDGSLCEFNDLVCQQNQI